MDEREKLLANIQDRMVRHGIFYPDIWERVLLTRTEVLREIADSDFDLQVLRMIREREMLRGQN